MATLSSIITPTNLVTATGTATLTNKTIAYGSNTLTDVVGVTATQTLTNKTLTAPTIASANLTTALTLAGAAGTNGQVLTSAGSGLPSWTTPSAGALILLSTVTASNSTTVDIETTFNSTYDVYVLIASALTLNGGSATLQMREKINGAYNTGSFYYSHRMVANAVSTSDAFESTATSVTIIPNAPSTQGAGLYMRIFNPSSTTLEKMILWEAYQTSGRYEYRGFAQNSSGTQALTGIRFFASSQEIVSGTFRLYGVANS